MDNFDWEFYINKYTDLKKAGINTKEKAFLHWITYGKKEKRICNNKNNKNLNTLTICPSPSIINASNIFKNIILMNNTYLNLKINVIFGCYSINFLENNINDFKQNKIIFGGSDTHYKVRDLSLKTLEYIKKHTNNIELYSISNFINNDLDYFKLNYKQIYLCLSDYKLFYNLNLLKKNIYIYDGKGKMEHSDIYNIKLINKILKTNKYNYNISSKNKVNYVKMNELLNTCFIGLRLTKHDGNSNIVQEMGLIGIKCIHNSYFYNSIPFYNESDIIKNINKEYIKHSSGFIDNVTPYVCKLNSLKCQAIDIFDTNNYEDDIVTVIYYTCNDTEENFCNSLKTILFQHMIKTKVIISTVKDDVSINYYNKYFKNIYNNVSLNINETNIIDKSILIENGLKLVKTQWFFILSTNEICYAFKCYYEIKLLKSENKKICISNYDVINYTDNKEDIINITINEINNECLKGISLMNKDILNKYLTKDFNINIFLKEIFTNESNLIINNKEQSYLYKSI